MNEQHNKWEKKEIVGIYLEGVRGAIPGASLQLEVLSKIINMWCPLPFRILDLGCGDGVLGRMLVEEHAAAHVTFTDVSAPMLESAKKKISDNARATLAKADFSTPDWINEIDSRASFNVIVSGFAIHHQPDDRKRELYTEIYGLLSEGGVFLNLDQVSSANPSGIEIFDSFFFDNIRRFQNKVSLGKTIHEIEEAYYQDKKDNIPAPIEKQCQWLRDIGFQDVDCFFKVFELALFGGRKTTK
jgi:tRNA (cmo5U34)-methyltransferase